MAGIKHNVHQVAHRIEARGPAVQREVTEALTVQAALMADAVRRRAPTFRSTLLQSVNVSAPSPFRREITVGVNYGVYVEQGRPPGKGLPYFDSPEAASLIAWLENKAGGPATRKRDEASHQDALRDLYVGWSRHVKRFGIRAKPFMKPAFDEHVGGVALALREAVERGLAAGGASA